MKLNTSLITLTISLMLFQVQIAYGQFGKLLDKAKAAAEKVIDKADDVISGDPIKMFEKKQPISTTFDDAVYEADILGNFEPRDDQYQPLDLQPRSENGGYKLKSGIYTMNAKSFCLRGYTYGPSKGDGHLYAPLKGKKAEFVQTIIERYGQKPEIPQQNVQVLLWAIIAGADMNTLGVQHSKTLNELFSTQELLTFKGKDWLGGVAEKEVNEFKNMLQRKASPQLQNLLDADNSIKTMVRENKTFQEIEKVAVIAGVAPKDMVREVSKGRWSYHPDGYFVRFFPNGYPQTRVDVYVPFQGAVQTDTKGKAIAIDNNANQPQEVNYNPSGMVASPANRPSQRIGISPLPVNPTPKPNPIDPNPKEKEYGITIITHGFDPSGSMAEDHWTIKMATEIVKKYGGNVYKYNRNTGQFAEKMYSNGLGETVLIFDWMYESNFDGEGFSEAAGDALFAALLRSGHKLVNLHFIGHSRGTVVNTECVLRLLSINIPVDHVTNLDPHDWGAGGIGSDFDNHPELPEISFPGANVVWNHPGVVSWKGVNFSDTYWQSNGAVAWTTCGSCKLSNLEGRKVAGTECFEWNLSKKSNVELCHTNIQDCGYLETIIDPTLGEGYVFSRLEGKKGRKASGNYPIHQSYDFFDKIKDRIKGVINGDFERGGSISLRNIPGWGEKHGGACTGEYHYLLGNNYISLKQNQILRHNYFYIPKEAEGIKFKFKNNTGCNSVLKIIMTKNGSFPYTIHEQKLDSKTDDFVTLSFKVNNYVGTVTTLEFKIEGNEDSEVEIDDVEFFVNTPQQQNTNIIETASKNVAPGKEELTGQNKVKITNAQNFSIPSIALKNMDGTGTNLKLLIGDDKNYLIVFWASWMGGCKKMLEEWKSYYPDWKNNLNLEIIAISVDNEKDIPGVKEQISNYTWTYPIFFVEDWQSAAKAFGSEASVPYVYIVKNNKIIEKQNGLGGTTPIGDAVRFDLKLKEILSIKSTENNTAPQVTSKTVQNQQTDIQQPRNLNTTQQKAQMGTEFPNVSMPSINENSVNTYEIFGKKNYTIIVTGYSCGPDMRLIKDLKANFNDLKTKYNVNVLYIYTSIKRGTITTNLEEDRDRVNKYLIEQQSIMPPPEWEYLFDVVDVSKNEKDRESKYLGKFNDATCPRYYVVNKTGQMIPLNTDLANYGIHYKVIEQALIDISK